ncbi:hypothetical protein [Dysgonomonas macrotermitis]|uniref:DUF3575 domain-containing protein n=1 Tax=Dysgonomonas macrotermitis TaxID=1346286 RepID=A0A1M5AZH0_9BACT|nr:hypothetical protein [Dysgonomonas macrotermitis]SHF35593.1 hypothetical protein SAMN05444362_105208 [Dysgonomonas macrotermitis]
MKRIGKISLLLSIAVTASIQLYSQEIKKIESSKKLTIGIESEVMCYINKGYHGSFWVGMNGIRSRFVFAKSTFPSSFAPDGFKNLTSTFYEMEVDFFIGKQKREYKGLWIAAGLGLTNQSIESKSTGLKGDTNLFDIHSGAGYAISLYKALYINPWIGIDIHTNTKNISVGNETWKPNIIDIVGGAKIGYRF